MPVQAVAGNTPEKITATLDPAKTSIHWTLQDVLHTVRGTFTLTGGVIHLDAPSGAANGLITIQAKSGQSGDSARDGRMQKSVLQSKLYPVISFRPTQFQGDLNFSKPEMITMKGIFSLHGTDHPFLLQIHVTPQGENMLHLTTQFVVPYVEWGLKDPSTFILRVGKSVLVNVDSYATVKP